MVWMWIYFEEGVGVVEVMREVEVVVEGEVFYLRRVRRDFILVMVGGRGRIFVVEGIWRVLGEEEEDEEGLVMVDRGSDLVVLVVKEIGRVLEIEGVLVIGRNLVVKGM